MNMKKTISTILLALSCLCFICGYIFCSKGFDKKDHYYQSEYNLSKNVNAYVGGDAYNYIINGTYFAGYCALGGAMFICGTIVGTAGLIGIVNNSKTSISAPQSSYSQSSESSKKEA